MLVHSHRQAHHRQAPAPIKTMIEFGHLTHPGLLRHLNEDTYYGDSALGLWLVADGMGGHSGGDLASAMARDSIVRQVRAGATLEGAIRQADADIAHAWRQRSDRDRPMGTSVICARIRDDHYEIAWVGDSRGYLWKDGRLRRVQATVPVNSTDSTHTARNSRQAPPPTEFHNSATQALGVTDPSHLHVSSSSGDWVAGMQLLLCSDGLGEELGNAALANVVSAMDCTAQETVDTLIDGALTNGGSDNITAVLIRAH